MSKLQELIQQLCPNGVEWKKLNELGAFYGGLTGKSKGDFANGNAQFVTYKNVYSNPSLNLDIDDFVKVGEAEKQNAIQYGDVLFTGSSETPDECGISSVVTESIGTPIYLNSFCFGFRPSDNTLFNPHFLKHLFRSSDMRLTISKTASGVTRYNVSKQRFGQIEIPLPPLPVQEEIVRILDAFTSHAAELQAELQARREQYEYYRNKLLSFEDDSSVEWKPMGEVGEFIRGNGLQKKDFTESGVGCIHYGQIYTHYGTWATKTKTFCSDSLAKKLRKATPGDLIMAVTSENVDDVCKSVAWLGTEDICISGDAFIYHHHEDPKYISYLIQTEYFQTQKKPFVTGTKVMRISKESLSKIKIPIPPLDEQRRIVAILDKFEALVNDLTEGLPAEIAARQEQYEYYRDKLLNFPKAV